MAAHKHAARYSQIVGVLLDEGLENFIDVTGLGRFRPRGVRVRRRANGEPEPIEVRVRHTVERLGPTAIKIGQALSTRPDLLPPDVAHELRSLQDAVDPLDFEQIRPVIEAELGGTVDEVFAEFDREPLASASIGQVHAAVLPDGSRVVVKVQRPGVRELVETDLDIMMTQARFLTDRSDFGDKYDIAAIASEMVTAIRGELDYVAEAGNAERLGWAFRDDETVAFPKVYWEYTTSRVLTLEHFEGVRMNRIDLLDEAGFDRAELARRGIMCYLAQIFHLGFFHADPHPGNLFALPDGRVGFTDFGRVGWLSERCRDELADLLLAIVDNDPRLAVDVMLSVGSNADRVDVPAVQREVARLIGKYYNRALGEVRVRELLEDILRLAYDYKMGLPSELAVLLATLAVLEGVGSELDPKFDFVSVTRPFAREMVNARMQPSRIAANAGRNFRYMGRLLTGMPEALSRLVTRVGDGDLAVTVRPGGFESLLARFEEAVNRLAFALVVGAFVVGLSMIIAQYNMPQWFLVVATLALLAAIGVGSWFFISAVLAHFAHRRGR